MVSFDQSQKKKKIDLFSLEGNSQITLSRTAVNNAGRNDNMISASRGCRMRE